MYIKPLTPLPSGIVLIVGAKPGNFDEDIRTHPRVTIWDSQNESWAGKDLPSNTRALFIAKWISHANRDKVVADARKRQITIFYSENTGVTTRQVKELLALTPPVAVTNGAPAEPVIPVESSKGKLKPLIQYINLNKGNLENAKALMLHAVELGITTTESSLAQLVSKHRLNTAGATGVPRSIRAKVDVSVEILDNMIQELTDMRNFLIQTVEENRTLRSKMEGLKKALGE